MFKETFQDRVRPLRRWTLCLVGFHETHSGGLKNNLCPCCGQLLRPEAFQDYIVTLKDGSQQVVNAISERHARSRVVYGRVRDGRIDARTGEVLDPMLVHPANIVSVHVRPTGQ